jgi:glutaconate CoA-transferase subunit A
MSKQKTLHDAIALVDNGSSIAFGGWTVVRGAMACARELVRQKKKNLSIVGSMSGPHTDLLIGAGLIDYAEISYHGLEKFGSAYNSLREFTKPEKTVIIDDITITDYTSKVMAGAMGIPFIPTYIHKGSDLLNMDYDMLKPVRGKNPNFPKLKYKIMEDPFWGMNDVVLVPAANPDFCFIHVQEVGENGTTRIVGMEGADYYLAAASKTTIITAEKVVSEAEISKEPYKNTIPATFVDIVVEAPYGAFATQCFGYYENDPYYIKDYIEASRKPETFKKWLDEWIYSLKDHEAFVNKLGKARLDELKADPVLGYRKNMKRKI